MKHSSFLKLAALCLSPAFVTVMPVYAETETPILKIKDTLIPIEKLEESRTADVEISLTNNKSGFRAVSFGIQYDENLTYLNYSAMDSTGQTFTVMNNQEQHTLWLMSASASQEQTSNITAEESILKLSFEIPENVNGGSFPLKFIWSGLDGSSAYWYADKNSNIIENIQQNAQGGSVSVFNPQGEELNYTSLHLNPNGEVQLEALNVITQVVWLTTDDTIATVSETGLVKAVSPGTCTVRAFIPDTNKFLDCEVTVADKYYYDVTDGTDLTITDPNITYALRFPDVTEGISWLSSNTKVITVSQDGVLTPVTNSGNAYVFGTYNGKTYMKKVIIDIKQSSTEPPEKQAIGDADLNGKINVIDVITVNRAILGLEMLSDEQLFQCDLNQNNKPDSEDSLNIMKRAIGLI